MGDQRVRISDIAEELGISTATVSNVLHGKTKKISDETVKRVQALLEERQYIPSMAGILLAQNSSKIIGVVVNDHMKYENHTLEHVFIASSINWLSEEIEKNGQFMMIKKTKEAKAIIKFASMWNMDGLVLIGFCHEDYTYLRSHMRIPFVVYDGYGECFEKIVKITIDNFDGGMQVGNYFRNAGHKKAICIADNDTCMDRERYEGFVKGFCEGVQVGEETKVEFMMVPMKKEERTNFYISKLAQFKNATAIFVVSDFYAIELVRFLTGQGICVPEDISVAGFDDIPMCQLISPTLTTVKQDGAMRAKLAISKLNELREGNVAETVVKMPVELIVRESTKEMGD